MNKWDMEWFQGFGCSPMKAVHDLSLEPRTNTPTEKALDLTMKKNGKLYK
jgi:hypothetical protein